MCSKMNNNVRVLQIPEQLFFLETCDTNIIDISEVTYIAPSSGHISFNFNMPFKLILRRCEVVF